MKSFEMGVGYLRQEALRSGFIQDSDNDDKLIERLSQVVRKLGQEDAEKADELSAKGKVKVDDGEEVEPSSDKRTEGKT